MQRNPQTNEPRLTRDPIGNPELNQQQTNNYGSQQQAPAQKPKYVPPQLRSHGGNNNNNNNSASYNNRGPQSSQSFSQSRQQDDRGNFFERIDFFFSFIFCLTYFDLFQLFIIFNFVLYYRILQLNFSSNYC